MRVLVICDDIWHPGEVIEMGIRGIGDGAYQFDVVKTAKDILTPEKLAQYQAVLIAKCNLSMFQIITHPFIFYRLRVLNLNV